MKLVWKDIIKAAVIGFVAPAILLSAVLALGAKGELPEDTTAPTTQPAHTQSTASVGEPEETEPTEPANQYQIPVLTENGLVEMELESYVLGVVLAEVPSSFESEALKAQAVAARTAALYICQSSRHDGAVCVHYSCCQAYISPKDYVAIGGTQDQREWVRSAVEATAGQVMVYEGTLICAAYFSCSGGNTENALAVWGTDIPYLQTVESPGEEFAAVFSDCFAFSAEEFLEALCVRLEGTPDSWFGNVTYTDGGGVETMTIGGVEYRGTTLRILLGLRSTVFSVTVADDTIFIETRGYGHRVGMSQYGAQAMALSGCDYGQILCHYYQGAQLSEYDF